MMKMTLTKKSDAMKIYFYATELAFEHGLDLPDDIEEWSDTKLLNYIARTEKEYGKLSPIG